MPTITKNLFSMTSDIAGNATHKISLAVSDFTALGASTSGTITVDIGLNVGDVIQDVWIDCPTQVSGTSITNLTTIVGVTGTTNAFVTTAADVAAAQVRYYRGVGTLNGGYGVQDTSHNKILVTCASTGANLSAVSAGVENIYIIVKPNLQNQFFY